MTHFQESQDVIRNLHGAKAKHLERVPIQELFQWKTVRDGIVEVLRLKGHVKADRVYPWMHQTDDAAKPMRYVTELHITPVVSSQTAVQAAIVQEFMGIWPSKLGRRSAGRS